MKAWQIFLILLLPLNHAFPASLSADLSASLNVAGFCNIVGVPSLIDVALDDKGPSYASFSFQAECNFQRPVSLSYTSSCTNAGKPCIARNGNLGDKLVNFSLIFNNSMLSPNTLLPLLANTPIQSRLIFEPAYYPGNYSGEITLLITY